MAHECEPNIEKLQQIQSDLLAVENASAEVIKKRVAIGMQLHRRLQEQKEAASGKAS